MCMHSSVWGGTESEIGRTWKAGGSPHHIPPRNSEETKKPELKPGLPGYYEDIFIIYIFIIYIKGGELTLFCLTVCWPEL